MDPSEIFDPQFYADLDRLKGGWESQKTLTSYKRPPFQEAPENAKLSAVVVLLNRQQRCLEMILRNTYKGVHSGQVGFVGGKVEPTDSFPQGTAMREASEEIGLQAGNLQVVGNLTPLYIPPSNFLVHPLVGLHNQDQFQLDPREVKEFIQIPVESDFLDSKWIQEVEVDLANGLKIKTPAFTYQGLTIWGASAMILAEFRDYLKMKTQ